MERERGRGREREGGIREERARSATEMPPHRHGRPARHFGQSDRAVCTGRSNGPGQTGRVEWGLFTPAAGSRPDGS